MPQSTVKEVVDLQPTKMDAWMNAFTGLGGSSDKQTHMRFTRGTRLSEEELEAMYHEDDMASRICDASPEMMLRKGFKIQDPEDPERARQVKATLDAKSLTPHITNAMVWGRLYGAGGLVLGVDDGRSMDRPLDFDAIRGLDFINEVDERDLTPATYYTDPFKQAFGEVETYFVQSTNARGALGGPARYEVHETRMVRFRGARTARRRRQENDSFHYSVLRRVYQVLQQFNQSWLSATHLLTDSSQSVYKIEGLVDMVAGGNKGTLQERIELIDMARSVSRSILLDAEREDFQQVVRSLTGIADLLDKTMIRLAAAARMPVTVLMGQSPAGMNATGDSDIANFHDQVEAERTQELTPALQYIVEIAYKAEGHAIPEGLGIGYPALRTLTDKEQAELQLTQAQADAIYMREGSLLPEEVRLNRFGPEGFSLDTEVDMSVSKKLLKMALKEILDRAENPPAPPGVPLPPEGEEPPEQSEAATVPEALTMRNPPGLPDD